MDRIYCFDASRVNRFYSCGGSGFCRIPLHSEPHVLKNAINVIKVISPWKPSNLTLSIFMLISITQFLNSERRHLVQKIPCFGLYSSKKNRSLHHGLCLKCSFPLNTTRRLPEWLTMLTWSSAGRAQTAHADAGTKKLKWKFLEVPWGQDGLETRLWPDGRTWAEANWPKWLHRNDDIIQKTQ